MVHFPKQRILWCDLVGKRGMVKRGMVSARQRLAGECCSLERGTGLGIFQGQGKGLSKGMCAWVCFSKGISLALLLRMEC